MSNLALPHSCAGVLFRYSGLRAYFTEMCLGGLWVFGRSNGANGLEDILNHGSYPVKQENSYLYSIEISNDVATISIDGLALPSETLDPTFQDQYIALEVDGNDPLNPSIDPNINPGALATFSQFTFQPLS